MLETNTKNDESKLSNEDCLLMQKAGSSLIVNNKKIILAKALVGEVKTVSNDGVDAVNDDLPTDKLAKDFSKKSRQINVLFSSVVVILVVVLLYSSIRMETIGAIFSDLKPKVPTFSLNNKTKVQATNSANEQLKAEWQPIEKLLASTDKRRAKLFKDLNLKKGEYLLACVSIRCGDCDKLAQELNQKTNLDNVIAITNAPLTEVEAWKARLGLKYRVEAISDDLFDDSGVVILPTLIKVRNAKAVGVSETASVAN
jgi:hypothetical protein